MTEQTSVILVDDHPVFRKGLRMLLEDEQDFSVIGEAGDGEEAIALIIEHQPDIAVLDISMPGISGIDVAERISTVCPNTRIVALSIHSEKRFVEDMLIAGAAGYILKQSAPEDLVNGIRTVMNGESFLSPSITSVVLSGFRAAQSIGQTESEEIPKIISTKLQPPQLPDNFVVRNELVKRLEQGSRLPVLLITAPAGYGKSAALNNWLQQQSNPFGWISLDETENSLRQFLFYFVHAVQLLFPGKLNDTQTLVSSAHLPPVHALAVSVLREIEVIEQDFIIVLDDVHLIREKAVFDFLSEILRHPPQHLHLIIMGRCDPFLPIASLRGKRLLTELRSRELRFSLEETSEYLRLMLGEAENAKLAEMLHEKMEGWIAGLRLAILSTDQASHLEEMLGQLKGDSQYVQEYLFNEVLDKQPPKLRSDIITLAILDRFCGPLCEALIRVTDSGKDREFSGWDFLKELKQSNIFLESLDSEKIWYRFHHLFQSLLKKQLHRSIGPEKIEDLHRIASDWFVSNGFVEEGINHAVCGQALDGAENIVRQNRHKEMSRDRWRSVEKWLSFFPEEAIMKRPTLLLAYAWVCHGHYRLQEVSVLVERLELHVSEATIEGADLGELYFLKGVLQYWQGNGEASLQCLASASELLPDSYFLLLGLLRMYESLALQMTGETHLVIEQLTHEILKASTRSVIYRSRLLASLVIVQFIEGDLHQASAAAERVLTVSVQNNLEYTRTWGNYILGNASFQLGDFDNAADYLSENEDKLGLMHTRAAVDTLAGLALARSFQQEQQEAFAISEKLNEFIHQTENSHLIDVVYSLKARLLLLTRDLDGAEKYLQSLRTPFGQPDLFMWLEVPELTLIRLLISNGSSSNLDQAARLMAELKEQAVSIHNNCHLIDIKVLETLLLFKTEGSDSSLVTLEEAVALAAAGGWIRPFIEGGRLLIDLLNNLEPATDSTDLHKRNILQIANTRQRVAAVADDLSVHVLEEPLTTRESEILELLALRLRNKEIGDKLFISPETVKSHIKRLFSKLVAVNRRDVVEKAIKLGLLRKD